MLKVLLEEKEVNLLASKHTNALKKYASIFNSEEQKKKYKLLCPLKEAKFSLRQAKSFDFKAGDLMWTNCSNWHARNKGGRPKLEESIAENINYYMKKRSSPAGNRYLKKLKMNAMYRNSTYKTAFNEYPLKDKIRLSFSTFKKKICKRFKKPHRLSDLCDLCEQGKVKIKSMF